MTQQQSDDDIPAIHQSAMHAIEQNEPFGEETTGPRVLRNESNIRNRVKREGKRAATRAASHQRLYNFAYTVCRGAIQFCALLVRAAGRAILRAVDPDDSISIVTPGGSTMDPKSTASHAMIVMNDALCAAAEGLFDAIGDECESTLEK